MNHIYLAHKKIPVFRHVQFYSWENTYTFVAAEYLFYNYIIFFYLSICKHREHMPCQQLMATAVMELSKVKRYLVALSAIFIALTG